MKQILRYSLVALLAMIVGNVMATDITFIPSDFTAAEKEDYSLTKDVVTVAVTASTVTADQIRVFKGQTITISSAVGNITKAVFTCTAEGTDKYGPGCFEDATEGSYSYDGRTGTWMGDAAEFMLTAKTNQVRITSIVVTVDGTAPTVLAPKFSVAGGSFFEPVTVALSCDTEGAGILYTVTGQDPEYTDDNNYSGMFYDGNPLTINQTTTIKAMAVKGGETSSIVEATYTIVELEEISVASALEVINGLGDGATTADVYKVKGFVTSVTEINAQYGNATFVIADSKDAQTGLTVFRVKGPHNENITDEEIIKVGDQVAVLGKLKKYLNDNVVTPEIVNGYIYSINEPITTTDTWTVAGTAPLVDNTWDPTDTNADMTSTDGVIFTYVKEDITLEAGVSYQFKVVKNHAWGEEYPSSNYVVTVNETAKYKVTITFNADSKEISCETVKTGEAGPVTHTWSVVGTLVGSWDDDVDMTKGDDGLYKLVVENVAKGDYAFKVRADHAWNISYPAQDYGLNVTQDGSTVTVTFNEETEEVNATISAPTGITTAKVVELSGAAYNLAGQKVDKNFKGIVIVNGKKMMQK